MSLSPLYVELEHCMDCLDKGSTISAKYSLTKFSAAAEEGEGGNQIGQGCVLPKEERQEAAGADVALPGAEDHRPPGQVHGKAQEEECPQGSQICAVIPAASRRWRGGQLKSTLTCMTCVFCVMLGCTCCIRFVTYMSNIEKIP